MINLGFLESLSPGVRMRIKQAYNSVTRNQISPATFFEICQKLLSPAEFSSLFSQREDVKEFQPSSEIKTEHLQDIIQYSGVDLKQEAENIVKDGGSCVGYIYGAEDDQWSEIESLMNAKFFAEFVSKICKARRLGVGQNVHQLLFLTVRRKLFDMYERVIEASKIRVDEEMQNYIVRIDNDVRRQLWVLEQNERKENERLKLERMESDEKKKLRKCIEEREDLLIKKRMSNTVALAALDIQQKSWMNADEIDVAEKTDTQFQSLYSPFNEKDLEKKISERHVTIEDLMFVLECDRRYNKSIFTIQKYYR